MEMPNESVKRILYRAGARYAFAWMHSLRTISAYACIGLFALSVSASLAHAAPQAAQFIPADSAPAASPLKIAAVDFLLPGYGTYVQQKSFYALTYFSANLVNLGLIYIAYRNWRFYESAYQAANKRQAQDMDPLQFQDPTGGGGYMTLQDIKNQAERGQLVFALSIVANIVLRGLSVWHSYSLAAAAEVKAGPRYEFYGDERGGMRAAFGYGWRF